MGCDLLCALGILVVGVGHFAFGALDGGCADIDGLACVGGRLCLEGHGGRGLADDELYGLACRRLVVLVRSDLGLYVIGSGIDVGRDLLCAPGITVVGVGHLSCRSLDCGRVDVDGLARVGGSLCLQGHAGSRLVDRQLRGIGGKEICRHCLDIVGSGGGGGSGQSLRAGFITVIGVDDIAIDPVLHSRINADGFSRVDGGLVLKPDADVHLSGQRRIALRVDRDGIYGRFEVSVLKEGRVAADIRLVGGCAGAVVESDLDLVVVGSAHSCLSVQVDPVDRAHGRRAVADSGSVYIAPVLAPGVAFHRIIGNEVELHDAVSAGCKRCAADLHGNFLCCGGGHGIGLERDCEDRLLLSGQFFARCPQDAGFDIGRRVDCLHLAAEHQTGDRLLAVRIRSICDKGGDVLGVMTGESGRAGDGIIGAVRIRADSETCVDLLVVCRRSRSGHIAVKGPGQRRHAFQEHIRVTGLSDRSEVRARIGVGRFAGAGGDRKLIGGIFNIPCGLRVVIVCSADVHGRHLFPGRPDDDIRVIVRRDLDIVGGPADSRSRFRDRHKAIDDLRVFRDDDRCLPSSDNTGDFRPGIHGIRRDPGHFDAARARESGSDSAQGLLDRELHRIVVDAAVLQVIGDAGDSPAGKSRPVEVGPVPAQGDLSPDILDMTKDIACAVRGGQDHARDHGVADLIGLHIQFQIGVVAGVDHFRADKRSLRGAVLHGGEGEVSVRDGQSLVVGGLSVHHIVGVVAAREQEVFSGHFLVAGRTLACRHRDRRRIGIRDDCQSLEDAQVLHVDRIGDAQDLRAGDRVSRRIARVIGAAGHGLIVGLDRRGGDGVDSADALRGKEFGIGDVHEHIGSFRDGFRAAILCRFPAGKGRILSGHDRFLCRGLTDGLGLFKEAVTCFGGSRGLHFRRGLLSRHGCLFRRGLSGGHGLFKEGAACLCLRCVLLRVFLRRGLHFREGGDFRLCRLLIGDCFRLCLLLFRAGYSLFRRGCSLSSCGLFGESRGIRLRRAISPEFLCRIHSLCLCRGRLLRSCLFLCHLALCFHRFFIGVSGSFRRIDRGGGRAQHHGSCQKQR